MKLLFENWRKFIKEDIGYFGNSFVEFKSRTEAGEHPLKVSREILEPIGKGSTRIVFGFPDNGTHLLKIINVEIIGDEEAYAANYKNPLTGFDRKHKAVSNENEADLKIQQRYQKVFPRSYEHAPDYSWILAERVAPIGAKQLAEIFNIPEELTRLENRNSYRKLMEFTIQLIGMYDAKPDIRQQAEAMLDGSLSEGSTIALDRPAGLPSGSIDNPINHAVNLLRDSHNRTIFRAVKSLGIPPRELLPKNLGISQFGQPHLVILDASLWEYDEGEEFATNDEIADSHETFRF
jgi:hypothetical protein